MKRERVIFVLIVCILFLTNVPNILASSTVILREEKAGGYQYQITQEQKEYKWKIGHKENVFFIVESKENADYLDRFRRTVNDLSLQKLEFILSISYLVLIIVSIILGKRKYKLIPSGPKLFLICLISITLLYSVNTYYDLYDSYTDANYYFHSLLNIKGQL